MLSPSSICDATPAPKVGEVNILSESIAKCLHAPADFFEARQVLRDVLPFGQQTLDERDLCPVRFSVVESLQQGREVRELFVHGIGRRRRQLDQFLGYGRIIACTLPRRLLGRLNRVFELTQRLPIDSSRLRSLE